jgi:hypothetical protein
MLFGAYRADQYADPDGFMMQLGVVLEQYSDEIVVYVTDPRTGVQRGSVWPPSIAEVVRACNARNAEVQRSERYRNWGRNNDRKLESPKGNRPSYEELIAKYGPNFGLDPCGAKLWG